MVSARIEDSRRREGMQRASTHRDTKTRLVGVGGEGEDGGLSMRGEKLGGRMGGERMRKGEKAEEGMKKRSSEERRQGEQGSVLAQV